MNKRQQALRKRIAKDRRKRKEQRRREFAEGLKKDGKGAE
jgi:hypothetical protein